MPEENNNEPMVSEAELKMPENARHEQKKAVLPVVLGVLIVVLLLILVGLYLWGQALKEVQIPEQATRPTAEENNEPESTNAEAEVETFGAVSTSDELDAIEADLESTNLETLDADTQTIETEFENAAR